jgi:hypothetical protein
MSFITSKLHNARQSLRAEVKKYKELDNTLRSLSPDIKQVYEMFPPSLRQRVLVSADVWGSILRMSMSLRDLDSFKDKKLTRLLEKFADWDAATSDSTYDKPNRDFYFTHKHPSGLTFRIAIYAYVKSDSPTCRIVVTGTRQRVVEEEIREIVCE